MKLSVKNLEFSYEKSQILKDIAFNLEEGSIMSLIGPNGSGKSTLLRCLNNILEPDSGAVYLGTDEVSSLSRTRIAQVVGYVPQSTPNPASLSVFETVLMGRKPHISWKADQEDLKKVSRIITDMGLEELSQRNLDQLSGGQLQKVAIARALAQEPEILLLDEPTSNLDMKHQLDIIKLIKEQARQGVSILVTVHDLSLAGRFSDRIIMLKEGEIFAEGGREVLTAANIEEVYGVEVSIQYYGDQILIVPEDSHPSSNLVKGVS